MNKTNRIRTPYKTREKDENLTDDRDNQTDQEDRCKLHLAECYLSKKRIDVLTNEIEEKEKQESQLKSRLQEMEVALKEKESMNFTEVNDYKLLVGELMNKIKIFEQNHEFQEIINYYEEKCDEYNKKNEMNVKMFVKMIEKFSNSNNNRDEIWRKAIKKFEEKMLLLENEIHSMKKFERSIYSRQKFFEKYSNQTEEKIEKFSKLQKKCANLENLLKDTNIKLNNNEKENLDLKKENGLLNEKCNEFRDEFSKLKKFFIEVQPILKLEWKDISSNNNENLNSYTSNSELTDYSSHNIIKLFDNVKEFLVNYQSNVQMNIKTSELINLNPILLIIDDLKKYMIVLLKKVQHLTINQFNIINICCDLNEKIQEYGKKAKDNSFEYLKLLKDLRNSCSKLLYDLHPEKITKKI